MNWLKKLFKKKESSVKEDIISFPRDTIYFLDQNKEEQVPIKKKKRFVRRRVNNSLKNKIVKNYKGETIIDYTCTHFPHLSPVTVGRVLRENSIPKQRGWREIELNGRQFLINKKGEILRKHNNQKVKFTFNRDRLVFEITGESGKRKFFCDKVVAQTYMKKYREEKHLIRFKDNNPQNIKVENLYLIPRNKNL